MGIICSQPMDVSNNISHKHSSLATTHGPISFNHSIEKSIMKIDYNKIIMENKMKILSDKVVEFTNVSLKPTIKELKHSKRITEDQKVTKKQFLDGLLDRCDLLDLNVADMFQLKLDLETKFIDLDLNLIEENKDINQEIEKYQEGFEELKQVYAKNDQAFKDIFIDFMNFRAYWDMIEDYEENIQTIHKDMDVISRGITNLFQEIIDADEFVEQHMINNINYDDLIARNILRIVQDSRKKFVGMILIFAKIQKKFQGILQTYKEQKDKKFDDQDVIKQKYKKIKVVAIEIRQQLGDMYVEKLSDQMEEKIDDLNQEIQDKLVKKRLDLNQNQSQILTEINEPVLKSPNFSPKATLRLDSEQDESDTLKKAQQLRDDILELKKEIESKNTEQLKKCELKVLGLMIKKQKQVTLQLLRLENETSLKIIDASLKKIDEKCQELREFIEQYSMVSPKEKNKDKSKLLLNLQQVEQGLKELIGYNLMSQSYKSRLQQVMDDTSEMIEIKQLTLRIPELRKIKDNVINLKIDIKQKCKELGTGKKKQGRQGGKYKDLSDKLMQNFIQKQKPEFIIERVTLNIYVFGDQKIVTKIHNGVLCVREDIGMIPIEKFYNDIISKKLQKQKGYSGSFKNNKESMLSSPKVRVNTNDSKNASSKAGNNKTQNLFTSPTISPQSKTPQGQSFTFERDNKQRLGSMKLPPKNSTTSKISIKKKGFLEQQQNEQRMSLIDLKPLISQKYSALDKALKDKLAYSVINPRSETSFQVDFNQSVISKGDSIYEQTITQQDDSYEQTSSNSDLFQQSGQILNTK
ncbi:UNKNOWN [Stylonychia lemnae]|uniref:Uncharacterized protein n=1 Tax=Stylonychia lemnae TaxID=5949 RepID=A0A078AQ72_STYLE|nr:UNKNOWN [Stylonychia lemnae]|eukprot:CDW83387.1 UNKNOWN [Stylonychia lemnae]